MLFAKEMRPIIKEENPELTSGELGKELGAPLFVIMNIA